MPTMRLNQEHVAMSITVNCSCGKVLHLPDELAGKRIKCTECFQFHQLPSPSGSHAKPSRPSGASMPPALPRPSGSNAPPVSPSGSHRVDPAPIKRTVLENAAQD